MQSSVLTTTLLPLALGIIMLGLGLALTLADFRRVLSYPRAVAVALGCQMILLPLLCFGLAVAWKLEPAIAVGLMLLAASPGGATANLYSHLSGGDVALNISLTAVNSILALFTLPLVVNLSIGHFLQSGEVVPMQFGKVLEVFGIVLVPVAIGMLVRHRAPAFADHMDRPVKLASVLFLVLIIAAVALRERQTLADHFGSVGGPVLAFNLLSLAVGYLVPRLLRVERRQAIAIGLEIGIHNATLAIFIALNVLKNSALSLPPAVYGLLMFFTAAAFGFLVKRSRV